MFALMMMDWHVMGPTNSYTWNFISRMQLDNISAKAIFRFINVNGISDKVFKF